MTLIKTAFKVNIAAHAGGFPWTRGDDGQDFFPQVLSIQYGWFTTDGWLVDHCILRGLLKSDTSGFKGSREYASDGGGVPGDPLGLDEDTPMEIVEFAILHIPAKAPVTLYG